MDKTVDELVPGETLLVSVKAVNGDKYSMEYAEIISNPNVASADPVTALFNASDPRFSTKARRAWKSGEKADIEKILGIELGSMAIGDTKDLNILNPKVGGKSLKIRIFETTIADQFGGSSSTYQKDNVESTCKRAGADGPFLYYGGKHIFSNPLVVLTDGEEAEHVFLASDPQEESAESAPAAASGELAA